jgi:hypothetical protein
MLGKQVAPFRHLAEVKAIPMYYTNQETALLIRHNSHSAIHMTEEQVCPSAMPTSNPCQLTHKV